LAQAILAQAILAQVWLRGSSEHNPEIQSALLAMEIKIKKRLTSCVAYSKRLSSKLGYHEISCSLTRVLHDLATSKWCDDRRRISLFQSLGFEDESNCWIPTPSVTTDDSSAQGVALHKAQSSQTDEKSYTETEIRAWTDSIVQSAQASIADLTGKLMALEQQLKHRLLLPSSPSPIWNRNREAWSRHGRVLLRWDLLCMHGQTISGRRRYLRHPSHSPSMWMYPEQQDLLCRT